MKRFRITWIIVASVILIALLVFLFIRMRDTVDDDNYKVTVAVDGVDIPIYTTQLNFQEAFENYMSNEICRYVALGSTVSFTFADHHPYIIKVTDFLLDKKGDEIYTEKEREAVEVNSSSANEQVSFILKRHPASFLSSNSKTYEPGNTLRGFKVDCYSSKNAQLQSYLFILQTDVE